jgi:hypothetical protein
VDFDRLFDDEAGGKLTGGGREVGIFAARVVAKAAVAVSDAAEDDLPAVSAFSHFGCLLKRH